MKSTALSIALLLASTSLALAAERSPACEAKRANIEKQIAEATSRGRSQEVAGLKRALAANKAECTDASLAKEREERIQEAQKEVAEREKDLAEAERKGDAKKIAKRKTKLDEARSELTEAEKPVGQ
jgi:hypothetical protein